MKYFLVALACLASLHIDAQSKKVLFIGNSYTGVNNLPQLVYDAVISTGDTMIFDKHTPGGTRLVDHASSAIAYSKIHSEDWDHVVLQAQSQEPSWPEAQVASDVFPHATALCNFIRSNNACSRPVFYMTWGRENGDAFNCPNWPPVCTYEGMDSLLNLRYRMMGADNESYVSPVGAVWRYVRENHPEINLYANDGSHPSKAGSYAAACTFYAILWQKDPSLITYNYDLSETDAAILKNAAKIVAYESLEEWNVGTFYPFANFTISQDGAEVSFTNTSENAMEYQWNFGDGESSMEENPVHIFQNDGTYEVELIVHQCGNYDTSYFEVMIQTVSTPNLSASKSILEIYPNPVNANRLNIELQNIKLDQQLYLINAQGIVLQKHQLKKSQQMISLNINDLPKGVYWLNLSNSKTGAQSFTKL